MNFRFECLRARELKWKFAWNELSQCLTFTLSTNADSTRPPPVALLDWKTRIQIARDAAAGIRVRFRVPVYMSKVHPNWKCRAQALCPLSPIPPT